MITNARVWGQNSLMGHKILELKKTVRQLSLKSCYDILSRVIIPAIGVHSKNFAMVQS